MVTFLKRVFGGSSRSIHNPEVPITSESIMKYLVGEGQRTNSGETITPGKALSYSPVWQAVSLVTGDISRLPFLTYKRTDTEWGEGKERAKSHPTYQILRRHTGDMTSNLWLARMVGHAMLYGNAFSRIRFRRDGRVDRLEWIHRDRVEVDRRAGINEYLVRYRATIDAPAERTDRVSENEMFHLVGVTLDELGGLSLVEYARDTIGRQLAAEHYADDFFANLAAPVGWFQHPAEMSAEAQQRFLAAVQRRHAGSGNRFKVGILEDGMTWNPAGMTPHDALMIDAMGWGVKDVARFFNIPPHRLGDDSRTAYNSIEAENRAFFNSTLGTWISRLEFEANWKLFTPAERDTDSHFSEFKTDALFKADTTARYAAHSVAIQWGIKSRNEVRAEENLNPYEGGDEYLTPLNMSAGGEDDETPPIDDPPLPPTPEDDGDDEDDQDDERSRIAHRDLLIDQFGRVVRRLVESGRRAANDPSKYLGWINSIRDVHGSAIRGMIAPALTLVAVSRGDDPEQLIDETLRVVFDTATETFLSVSECQSSELKQRTLDSADRLSQVFRDVATDVVF